MTGHHHLESTGSVYNNNSSERNGSIPIPPLNPLQPQPNPNPAAPPAIPKPIPTNPSQPSSGGIVDRPIHHRFLTPTEWARVAHGIGAIRAGGEEHAVVHPTAWYWPTRGMPEGLYRDVVGQRAKYALGFQLLSALRWSLLVLQVMVGAALTALGSLSLQRGVLITALGAVSTVGAGVVGLMHNSGLPDRYRMDRAQFVQVEDFIRVRIIPSHSRDQGHGIWPGANVWCRRYWTRASSRSTRRWRTSSTSASGASPTLGPL